MNLSNYKTAMTHIRQLIDKEDHSKWDRAYVVSRKVSDCDNGTEIRIDFPGNKAGLPYSKESKYRYDFRVAIVNQAKEAAVLSHADIAGLLFIAVRDGVVSKHYLMEQVIHLGATGTFEQQSTTTIAIGPDVAEMISRGYQLAKKAAPYSFQRPIELGTLLDATFWILVQEELNYPMPVYQGRKMAIKRFIEAIHCATSDRHNFEEIVSRILNHGKVYDGLPFVDYSDIEEIQPLGASGLVSSIEKSRTQPSTSAMAADNAEDFPITHEYQSFIARVRGWLGL